MPTGRRRPNNPIRWDGPVVLHDATTDGTGSCNALHKLQPIIPSKGLYPQAFLKVAVYMCELFGVVPFQ